MWQPMPGAPATRWPFRLPPGVPPAGFSLHLAGALASVVSQVLITWTTWQASTARPLLGLFTMGKLAVAASMARWPAAYWRHRFVCLPAMRILLHLLPHVRQSGVGVSLLLEHEARPGLVGVLADAARIMAGTRQLELATGGFALLMPPTAMLLQQGTLLLLSSNSEAYCTSQLMLHPLMQRRAATFAAALEYAIMPCVLVQPVVPQTLQLAAELLAGEAPAGKVCAATLSFVHVALCVVLPTLLSAYCWVPEQDGAPSAAEQSSAPTPEHSHNSSNSQFRDGQASSGPPSEVARVSGWQHLLARLTHSVRRAMLATDRCLHYSLCNLDGRASRAVVAWWLLAMCWLACKQWAGLR